MASTTLLYSVLEYLNGLKSTSERPEAIDSISTQIQEIFGLQISPENFKELSYSPVGLNEIFSAGVNALDLQHYEESLSNAQLNPKFDAFVSTVQKKGFFDGAEEGSVEYLQRYSKLINKFKDKTVAKASTAPSTAASVVEAAPVENNAEIEKQAEELKSQGNTAISAKNYLEAAVLYSKALKLSSEGPNSHIYYSNRAAAYCHLGKYQEAVNDCKASLALSADYVKAFSRLGLSYFFLEQYEDAVEAYKRAVDLEPDNKASIDSLRQAQNKLAKVQQRASAVSAAPGAGGLPDMASMMNKGAMKQAMDKMGGSAGLANLMKDPNMMAMAQQMMKDPAMMQQAMSMMGGGGGGGGMPDMSALAGLMGGLGGGGSDAVPSSSSSGKKPFKGFEE